MADDEITFEEATQAPDEISFEEASQPEISPAAALPFAVTAPLQAVGALRNVIENPLVGRASEGARREAETERILAGQPPAQPPRDVIGPMPGIEATAPFQVGGTTITPSQEGIGIPYVRPPKEAGTAEKIAAGAFNTIAGIPNFILSPTGLATMIAPEALPARLIGPTMQAAFTEVMGKATVEAVEKAWKTKDPQDIAEAIGAGGFTALIARGRSDPEFQQEVIKQERTQKPSTLPPKAPEGWKFDGTTEPMRIGKVSVPAKVRFTRTVEGQESTVELPATATPEEIQAKLKAKEAEYESAALEPAKQFAEESGWTFNQSKQIGGMNLEGLSKEQIGQLKAAGYGPQWEFTDKRPGSVTEGITFYVPENADVESIRKAYQVKNQQEASTLVPQPDERIQSAAFFSNDRKFEPGANHPEILTRLGIGGFETPESRNTPAFGYLTNKGRFLTREQAGPFSEKTGQALKDFEPGEPVHSNEVASPTEPEKPLSETTPAKSLFEQYNDFQRQMEDLKADGTIPMAQRFARMSELSKQIEALKNLDPSPEKGNAPKGMPPKEPIAPTGSEKPLSETEPVTPAETVTPAEPVPAEYSTTSTPETAAEQAEQQKQVVQQTETTQQESHESVSHYTEIGPGNETGVEMSRHGTATGLPPGVPAGGPRFPQELLAASHRLGTVVRTKATLRPGVLGQYVHARAGVANSDKIEVGDLHNQLTVAHEMGHDLDQLLWPQVNLAKTQKSFIPRAGSFGTPKEIFNELKPISELMRGPMTGSKGHVQYRRSATELIADFFALYAHDPARARTMAPKFSKAFEAALARNPDAEQVIRELHAGNVTPASPQSGQPAVPAAAGMPGKVPARPAPVTASRDAQVLVSSQGLVKGLVRLFEAFVQRARVASDNWRVLVKKQADRNDVGAFVEGIGNLEIPGDTRAAVVNRMTPAKYEMAKQYTFAIEDQRGTINRFLKGTTDGEYLDFLNDYLPHFYVNSKTPAAKEAVSRWSKNSPNAKQRKIPTLQEAVGLGLTPISQDPAVLYELHARINWRVAVNRKLIAELGDMKTAGGQPVLVPWGKQPGGYVQSNNPLIQRVYAIKSGGATMLWRGGAGIHPDAWPAVRQMLETPSSWTVSQYYDALNSITRANAFAFSMFHDLTLRFASVGTQWSWYNPARGLFRVFERNPTTGELEIFRSTRGLGKELLMNQDTVADAALHGLKFSWTDSESYERNARDFLEHAAARYRDVPYLGTGVRLARDFQHMRQKGLWRNTHDAYKIAAYNDLVSKALQDAPPGTNSYEVKSRIASLLNDTFGGQEWQTKFWLSPQARRTMARFFLAPDWTFSTLRSVPFLSDAFSVVRGQAPRVIGRESKPTPREGIGSNLGRLRFWGGEIAALAIATLSAQYAIYHAFGRKEKGDKEWVWDNEEGQKRRIDVTPIMRQMPWHDKNDPTRYYVNLGKRPEEIIGWVTHSDQNIYAKLARPVAEVIRQITGTEGDFKAQWKRDHESFAEEVGARAKSAAGTLIPFVFAGNQFALSLPYRKGMTKYKAQQAYASVYELAADPGRFTKAWAFLRGVPSPEGTLREMVETITDAAERNGVQADPVRKRALSEVRGKYYDAYFKAYDKGDQKAFEKSAQALHNLGATAPQMSRSLHRREELKPFLPP